MNYAKPFLPNERTRSSRPVSPIVKLAVGHLMAFAEHRYSERVIQREYGDDVSVKEFLKRTATAVASTSSPSTFSMTGNVDYMGGLGASSAGLALLASEGAMSFELGSNAALNVASVLASASGAGFVLEASALPVRSYSIDNATLTPKKFACVSVFNREIFQYSRPSIEQVVRASIQADIALAFDTALFDANAGTATRLAGLRYNISANATGASAASSLQEAMNSDLETVIAAVSAVAANGPIIVIASPRQAVALRLRQRSNYQYPVFSSAGLADGVIMAVAVNCLISAIDPVPRFEVSDQTILVMDSSPAQITTLGTPTVLSYPIVNLFQEDKVALRVVFDVAFALRSATGLSWLGSVKW